MRAVVEPLGFTGTAEPEAAAPMSSGLAGVAAPPGCPIVEIGRAPRRSFPAGLVVVVVVNLRTGLKTVRLPAQSTQTRVLLSFQPRPAHLEHKIDGRQSQQGRHLSRMMELTGCAPDRRRYSELTRRARSNASRRRSDPG
jgi:hypothetical protein